MSQIQSKETDTKVHLKFLQVILSKEDVQAQKGKLEGVIKKFENSRNKKQLTKLLKKQEGHYKYYEILLHGFDAFHQAYNQLISLAKYQAFKNNGFDVINYLSNIQPNIQLEKNKLAVDEIMTKYVVQILKLKRGSQYKMPADFYVQWNAKAKDKLHKFQQWAWLLISNQQSSKSNVRNINSYDSQSDQNESQVLQPVQPAKETKARAKRSEQTVQIIRGQNAQFVKQNKKNRLQLMQKYLDCRKDLTIEKGKSKQISEHLLNKLQYFMKYTLSKLIDIAVLKSKKNIKIANQIEYFHPSTNRVTHEQSFQSHPHSVIYTLGYKHRLEIYSQLRIKEFKKEEQLRSALEAKTNQFQKKIDKKIQTYILKPRSKQIENFQPFKQSKEATVVKIGIHTEHVIYYLQNHKFLRNSHLYFNACHS